MEIIETKECKTCCEVKNLDEFYQQNKIDSKGNNYIYYTPECKKCTAKRTIDNRNENREENLEKMREYYKEYIKRPEPREKHREVVRRRTKEGKNKQWYKENPDKFKLYISNHRHHEITKKEWLLCKEYFNNSCAYCGLHEDEHYTVYDGIQRKSDLHKEHVEHDGENDLSNCVPSCRICNSSKWKYELCEWYNNTNPNFTKERLLRINKWINEDYLLIIEEPKAIK